jgi:hypothetical protein
LERKMLKLMCLLWGCRMRAKRTFYTTDFLKRAGKNSTDLVQILKMEKAQKIIRGAKMWTKNLYS